MLNSDVIDEILLLTASSTSFAKFFLNRLIFSSKNKILPLMSPSSFDGESLFISSKAQLSSHGVHPCLIESYSLPFYGLN